MKLSTNLIVQALAILVQVLNYSTGVVPEKYKPIVLTAVGVGQALVAGIAHNFNTDGTPQSVAFKPEGVKGVAQQ